MTANKVKVEVLKLFTEVRTKCGGESVLVAKDIPYKEDEHNGVMFSQTASDGYYLLMLVRSGGDGERAETRVRAWELFKNVSELERCVDVYGLDLSLILSQLSTNIYRWAFQHRDIFDHSNKVTELCSEFVTKGEIRDDHIGVHIHELIAGLPISGNIYQSLGVMGVVELECAMKTYVTGMLNTAVELIHKHATSSKKGKDE